MAFLLLLLFSPASVTRTGKRQTSPKDEWKNEIERHANGHRDPSIVMTWLFGRAFVIFKVWASHLLSNPLICASFRFVWFFLILLLLLHLFIIFVYSKQNLLLLVGCFCFAFEKERERERGSAMCVSVQYEMWAVSE